MLSSISIVRPFFLLSIRLLKSLIDKKLTGEFRATKPDGLNVSLFNFQLEQKERLISFFYYFYQI